MLTTIAQVLVGLVALIQIIIGFAEMFFWKNPVIHKRIGYDQEKAGVTAPIVANIVANAGLYNWFLAAGLVWGLLTTVEPLTVETFFLACVFIAGVFGAVTLKWTTLVLQSLPSLVALAAVWYVRNLV